MTIKQRIKGIMDGRRMSDKDFLLLYEQGELLEIGQAANLKREERFGNNQATFIIDRNINYSNICSCKCRFCAFYRDKEDADAYVISQ
ncbi:MAG: dehypoxanthine futalosine cyclase, partial [Syntrophomonas sp.]|nr:dehypoxanthine futalosine cyclase [Syntrophomonas sp.]